MSKYEERVKRATRLMEEDSIDVLLLSKPANMFYLTGDGRLCAYAMVTRDGKAALGVPMTMWKTSRNSPVSITSSALRMRWV